MWGTHFLLRRVSNGTKLMSFNQKDINAKTIRAKLIGELDTAIEAMKIALRDASLSSKDRYKIASDYLGWIMKVEDKILRDEDHAETMKFKKLKTKIASQEFEEREVESFGQSVKPLNQPKFTPFLNDDEKPS